MRRGSVYIADDFTLIVRYETRKRRRRKEGVEEERIEGKENKKGCGREGGRWRKPERKPGMEEKKQ